MTVAVPAPQQRYSLRYIPVMLLPLGLALSLSWLGSSWRLVPPQVPELQMIRVHSVSQLERLFKRLGYSWPLPRQVAVPRVIIESMPADLDGRLPVQHKKALFLRLLLPLVVAENQYLAELRNHLQTLFGSGRSPLAGQQQQWLVQLARQYGISGDLRDARIRQQLLQRIDVLPVSLVLAQAANESGWGTSRFVHQGNNLFGEWTYRQDQGLMPRQRSEGKHHLVRVFPSLRDSVRSYMKNINSGRAYHLLRQIRSRQRQDDVPLDSLQLAAGLERYSERGDEYVAEIRRLIQQNRLTLLDSARLLPAT